MGPTRLNREPLQPASLPEIRESLYLSSSRIPYFPRRGRQSRVSSLQGLNGTLKPVTTGTGDPTSCIALLRSLSRSHNTPSQSIRNLDIPSPDGPLRDPKNLERFLETAKRSAAHFGTSSRSSPSVHIYSGHSSLSAV